MFSLKVYVRKDGISQDGMSSPKIGLHKKV